MPTTLPQIPKETYAQFDACVHCGLCLPACPTYLETQNEADAPRGRIHLMKALVDQRVAPTQVAFEHLDRCLVCRACETACPSGVNYHELIEHVRPLVAEAVMGKGKHMQRGTLQWAIEHVLPHAKRMKAALVPLKVARAMGLGGVIDRALPGMRELMDASRVQGSRNKLPRLMPARGTRRGSVVLLRGCVGSVVSHGVNGACARVLSRNGFDVHMPEAEPCCGSLAAHANDPDQSRALAEQFVGWASGVQADYFISPIAGCGAQLKSHGTLLAGTSCSTDAANVSAKMRDICEFLADAGIARPPRKIERTVTYHDPCHLAHAQRITAAPRKLLAMIDGLKIVPLQENDVCCGAAGTYSLNQPAMADALGRRKVRHITATGAQELITANIGCALQITRHLKEAGKAMQVRHIVELLDEAYGE